MFVMFVVMMARVTVVAIFLRNRVAEKEVFHRETGEEKIHGHNNDANDAREEVFVRINEGLFEDEAKSEAGEKSGNDEDNDVDGEDEFFEKSFVGVEQNRNDDDWHEEREAAGEPVVRVRAEKPNINKRAGEEPRERKLDVFPSAFVDGGEDGDKLVLFAPRISEVEQTTK